MARDSAPSEPVTSRVALIDPGASQPWRATAWLSTRRARSKRPGSVSQMRISWIEWAIAA